MTKIEVCGTALLSFFSEILWFMVPQMYHYRQHNSVWLTADKLTAKKAKVSDILHVHVVTALQQDFQFLDMEHQEGNQNERKMRRAQRL